MPITDPAKRKEYMTKYHREVWYPKNKEKRYGLVLKNRERVKDLIQSYKLKKGCLDCGYKKLAEALEFDHLSDKVFEIGKAVSLGYGWERIKTEIDKCEVVCSNCHRARTVSRR